MDLRFICLFNWAQQRTTTVNSSVITATANAAQWGTFTHLSQSLQTKLNNNFAYAAALHTAPKISSRKNKLGCANRKISDITW